METMKIEQARLVAYSDIYFSNSTDIVQPVSDPSQAAPGKSNTSSGKAKRTIQTRKTVFGQKTMSDAAHKAAQQNSKNQPTK